MNVVQNAQNARSLRNNPSTSNTKPRPIIVTGPTGVGKSSFAVALAVRLGGEVIGADAYQIYAGLPILTAQPSQELQALVPHHLIGFLDLRESFDVARYQRLAHTAIADIQSRHRTPIIVGGTGLYLKSLTHGLANIPPIDPLLREQIATLNLSDAIIKLASLDPDAPAQIDLRNPVRVRRALEIVLSTGNPLAKAREQWKSNAPLDFCGLVLSRRREELHSRIESNVASLFECGGVEEVRSAQEASLTASKAIGYREIQALLRGETTLAHCQEAIILATRQYSKRQITWCRTQFDFPVLELSQNHTEKETLDSALSLLNIPY
jgi:tRNA dimethylallyltransferase